MALKNDKVDAVRETTQTNSPDIIDGNGELEGRSLDRSKADADGPKEFMPEPDAAFLVPPERFNDIGSCRFPNE